MLLLSEKLPELASLEVRQVCIVFEDPDEKYLTTKQISPEVQWECIVLQDPDEEYFGTEEPFRAVGLMGTH